MMNPLITEMLMRSLATATFLELPQDRSLLAPPPPVWDERAETLRRAATELPRLGVKGWLLRMAAGRLHRA